MGYQRRETFSIGQDVRYVESVPVVPGIYRMGPVYVQLEAKEIQRLQTLSDLVALVRGKIEKALGRLHSYRDIDDFFPGQRRGTFTETKGPVADLMAEREETVDPDGLDA